MSNSIKGSLPSKNQRGLAQESLNIKGPEKMKEGELQRG